MRPLSASELLRIWELGQRQPAWQRALLLVAPIFPEHSQRELAALSLGQRNAHVFALRAAMFGPIMLAVVQCPRCAEALEFTVDGRNIWGRAAAVATEHAFMLSADGFEREFRLLDSRDLAFLEQCEEPATARRALAERCLVRAEQSDTEITAHGLPEPVMEALGEQLAEHDPLSDVRFRIDCAACQHQWSAPFDIVSFVWTELSTQAERLLDDVHTLARAYGWRESDILSMSAARRQGYLERAV